LGKGKERTTTVPPVKEREREGKRSRSRYAPGKLVPVTTWRAKAEENQNHAESLGNRGKRKKVDTHRTEGEKKKTT